jgi:four helix bundle protein
MVVNSYKDLIVWQKSIELVVAVYELTEQFPKEELYGLSSQMKRSAVSIPSNIAEGRRDSSRIDFRRFILIAYGSGMELETQVTIAKKLPFGKNLEDKKVDSLIEEVLKMLNAMIKTLKNPKIVSPSS